MRRNESYVTVNKYLGRNSTDAWFWLLDFQGTKKAIWYKMKILRLNTKIDITKMLYDQAQLMKNWNIPLETVY